MDIWSTIVIESDLIQIMKAAIDLEWANNWEDMSDEGVPNLCDDLFVSTHGGGVRLGDHGVQNSDADSRQDAAAESASQVEHPRQLEPDGS